MSVPNIDSTVLPRKKINNLVQTLNRINNQPYFLDMETSETLFLQTIPTEFNYEIDSSWNTITSAGRNNPLYHYTGSEDTLNFTISWYADQESREDVLANCKWLESMSKNNGYIEKPHRLKFMFGRMFSDSIWIMHKASYRSSLFNRQHNMLPCLAIQEISMKRVTEVNTIYKSIRQINT